MIVAVLATTYRYAVSKSTAWRCEVFGNKQNKQNLFSDLEQNFPTAEYA
jgi:hypothetical protein